jgi:nucleotide-binding universal stress UspA family protein
VDTEAIEKLVGRRVRSVYNYAADALVAASADADLVVLGSRGLHGIKSLGSVSERVAHQAASSVLIVRAPS